MHQTRPHRRAAVAAAAVTASLVGLLAAGPLAPAHAERTRVVSVQEDCHEVAIPRAVSTSGLRELVPERHTINTITATASRLWIITVTCQWVRVEPGSDRSPARRTTYTLGAVPLTASDGVPTRDHYLLWWGTDNPEEAAKLRQLGLPITFQPGTTSTVSEDGATNTLAFDLRGGGLDYRVDAVGNEPGTAVTTSEMRWVHDGPDGTVLVTAANRTRPASTAVTTADFSTLEPLIPILVSPVRPTNVPFTYFRGGWTMTAELVDREPEGPPAS